MGENSDEDDINFDQLQKRLKQKIFQLNKCYLQHCEQINPIFIYVIIVIESLQILWFSIHPQLTFLKNPFILTEFRQGLAYLNFENWIHGDSGLLFTFVLLSSSFILIYVLSLVLSVRQTKQRKKTQISNLVNRITAFQIVLVNSVLFIPIYNVSIATLYCEKSGYYYLNSELTCYGSVHIGLCVLSGLNLLVLLVSGLLYWFIFYTRNPFSHGYYALSNNLFRLGKLAIKILMPLYFVVDQKQTLQNVYVIIQMVLILAYIVFFRINSIHNSYENYFYFQTFCQSVILWFCINTAICYKIDNVGMNFVQSCICSLFFAYAVCMVQLTITRKFFQFNIGANVKKQDRERFVNLLISVLFKDGSQNEISPLVYIKLLNSNLNLCSIKISKFMHKSDLKTEEISEICRELLLNLLSKFLQQSPSINLKIIKSLILFNSGLKILSLHEVSELRNDKLSIYEQFMIYYFKATHFLYQESDMKKDDENINEINTYLEFVECLSQFEGELELCAKNNEHFWEELCEEMPSINKVYNLAEKSVKFTERVSEVYKKIETIFPDNLAALHLYYQFLCHVCARHKEHNKIKQKWMLGNERELKKESMEFDNKSGKIKFRANQKMCVLHVSTNTSTIGIITNCNSELKNYLGYERSELLNQKVTKIMPKIFTEIHDKFIRNYLDKADSMKLLTEKIVFAFRKDIIMVQTCLVVKIFPNIVVGFQLVGFFKESRPKQPKINIMVNLKTLQIEGITDGFLKMAGNRIKMQETLKEPLKISHLFPQIEPNYQFKQGSSITTLLRFSDCTDKLIDIDEGSEEARKKYDKNIVLKLESISIYPQVQIGIFSVSEPQSIISMHQVSRRYLQPKPKPQRANKAMINKQMSISNSIYKQIEKEEADKEQTNTIRKIEEYINKNSHLFQIMLLKALFFFCFTALTLASIFINVYEGDTLGAHRNILDQLTEAKKISVLEGQIITQNRMLVLESDDAIKWEGIRKDYMSFLLELRQTATNLFQKANDVSRRKQNLVINQYDIFEFKAATYFTNSSQQLLQTQQIHYYQGLLKTIFLGLDLLNNPITAFQPPLNPKIHQSFYFIQQNLKSILPNLAEQTTKKYGIFFDTNIKNELANTIYFVTAKTTTFILFYCIMCLVINKFSKFNYTLVELFNSILKWDAYELYLKCHRFRTRVFEPPVIQSTSSARSVGSKNDRSSDIWKMFPKGLLFKLSQGLVNRAQNERNMKTSIITQSAHKEQQEQQASHLNEKQRNSNRRTKQMIYDPIDKLDHINIKIQISLKKRFLALFLLLISLTCINYSAVFFKSYYNQQLMEEKQNNVNLGRYCKNFLYAYFYGTEIVEDAEGAEKEYWRLFRDEMDSFYSTSKNVSALVGDPLLHLRNVYQNIQLINSLVNGQLILNNTIKDQMLHESRLELFNISDSIKILAQQHKISSLQQIQSSQKIIKILKIIFDIGITIVFCYLAHLYLIRSAQRQLQHSCNMIRMVPVWVVKKNRKIREIMFVRKEESNSGLIGDGQEDTALNLGEASKVNQEI